jgi:hypothetical protein
MSTDWQPLERMLGPSLCVDFMFMGRSEQIHLYKHRDTRRYLNIAPDGTCFRYSAHGYQPIGLEEAIEQVFPLRIAEASRRNDKGVGKGEKQICQRQSIR